MRRKPGFIPLVASVTLLLGAGLSAVTGAAYARVAWLQRAREVPPESVAGARAFTLAWAASAAAVLVGSIPDLLAAFGVAWLPAYVTLTQVDAAVAGLALGSFAAYYVFLMRGRASDAVVIAAYYALLVAVLLLYVNAAGPLGVRVTPWSATLHYRVPPTNPVLIVLVTLLFIPVLVGVAFYASLWRKVETAQRYRILLTAGSPVVMVLSWVAVFVTVRLLRAEGADAVASGVSLLTSAVVILLAYEPPTWVQRRLASPATASPA